MASLLRHDSHLFHWTRLHACATITVPSSLIFLEQRSRGPLRQMERHHCDELALEHLRWDV